MPGGAKSVLIVSASAGAGHGQAAKALVETAGSLSLPVETRIEDVLDFTFPLFKKIYGRIQFAIVDVSPELWGYLYKRTQSKRPVRRKSPVHKLFDRINYRAYLKSLRQRSPDAIVCTHFLPYVGIEDELSSPNWSIPVFSVTTDYDLHSIWVSRAVSRYYVATDEAAWTLQSRGVDPAMIAITGIPVAPRFSTCGDRSARGNELGLRPDAFTVLVLSGGNGVGGVDRLVPSVAEFLSTIAGRSCQLIVVCGKNPSLHDRLSNLKYPASVPVRVYAFIDFVDKLMDCADVLVTKAGALTVTEALVKHLPIIVFDPTPGQEGRNTDFLLEHGTALMANNFSNLHYKLKSLIEHPEMLERMRGNAERIARPDAARVIWEDVLNRIR